MLHTNLSTDLSADWTHFWAKSHFYQKEVPFPPSKITFLVLKEEATLELWAGKKLIKEYALSGFSGTLGPKLRSGDRQIPEGIYKVVFLNPNSSYHLSMKINYPNLFDLEKARVDQRTNLGGDIFIHGKNNTIGCIPIGDKNIEELFSLVYTISKENVHVIISPYDMRTKKKNIDSQVSWENELYSIIFSEMSGYSRL